MTLYGSGSMATRRERRRPSPDEAAQRGALVTGAAVLLGAIILGGISTRPSTHVASAPTTTTTRPQPTTTAPVTAAPHTPDTVTVLVLNGVDPKKAIAKPAAATVAAAGFTTAPARDAAVTVTKSIVYFIADYEADAKAVAAFLSIPPASVVALPSQTPVEIGDPAGAQVIVVVGPDAPAANG
jgi:hypothetical protein